MSTKMRRLLLMACAMCPTWAGALGLGEIHLRSALDEPLNADIDLIAATPDELTSVHAALAPVSEYTRFGVDHPAFLSSFHFQVVKAADGHSVLRVTSTDSIPEPFVTFLIEVDWSRGHLMREYTVLLDPPVYASGHRAEPPAPVAMPSAAPPRRASRPEALPPAAPASSAPAAAPAPVAAGGTYQVGPGDTLTRIAQKLGASGQGAIDQTMLALFRANPDAFGGNVNLLHRGAILRVPDADRIAAVQEHDAIAEIDRQMSAWRSGNAASGRLRLVAPGSAANAAGNAAGAGTGTSAASAGAGTAALRAQVKDLEGQLATERHLLELRNNELAALQAKLGVPPTAAAPAAPAPAAVPPPAPVPPASAAAPAAPAASAATAPTAPAALPPAAPKPMNAKPAGSAPAAAPTSGSWLDWLTSNWWLPGGILVALLGALGFTAYKRRQAQDSLEDYAPTPSGGGADLRMSREPTMRSISSERKSPDDSFVVEESGEHKAPEFPQPSDTAEVPAADDTLSSESAVNLDQGDPLAEADFHMAYGLYDQAADLVRIALEREPDRRDLRLKLLEIYFVWGNKDLFLQTAKNLYASRDKAPAGEWDKIVIMGKQICPDDPLFAQAPGGGRGAGATVDLNLEGGENRVDVDLFGEPPVERSPHDAPIVKESEDNAATGESPQLHGDSGLDFVLDTPERGADESPTREMPKRDEPTVESEMVRFGDAAESPTTESPALSPAQEERAGAKRPMPTGDQTAEVSIDDLGLDLDALEQTGSPGVSGSHLEQTDHPSDAPTMVAGLDERSRRMMQEAESHSHDRDLTELERELEASFISELEASHGSINTSVIPPEAAPTVQMPRASDAAAGDSAATSRVPVLEAHDLDAHEDVHDAALDETHAATATEHRDPDATSRLHLSGDSVDLDLDRLAGALGGGDTVDQPRAAEDIFSSEVFEASQRSRRVDLDLGSSTGSFPKDKGAGPSTSGTYVQPGTGTFIQPGSTGKFAKPGTTILQVEGGAPSEEPPTEFEPVTMSEVGTKLDLARAYMDMGDPEGARSILDEVVQEGSASQKQEAERLLQSLPG